MGVAGVCEDTLEESYQQVRPVLDELYGTPIPGGGGDGAGAPAGVRPPTPNVDAARARFVEGGELLPSGGKLCLFPDGSGFIVMPPLEVILAETPDDAPDVKVRTDQLDEAFDEACPEALR